MVDHVARPERPEVAVIAGASGSLGHALATAFARRGVATALVGRAKVETEGDAIVALAADIAEPDEVHSAFEAVRTRLGNPTVLIGFPETDVHRDILEETPESFMATIKANLGGSFACCHAVLPDMVAAGRGRIVLVHHGAAEVPPMRAAFTIADKATRCLTEALVADLGDRFPGIIVNDWMPGLVRGWPEGSSGIEPALAAEWGVALAMMREPRINGLAFSQRHEHRAPLPLLGRIKARVLGKARPMVTLTHQ